MQIFWSNWTCPSWLLKMTSCTKTTILNTLSTKWGTIKFTQNLMLIFVVLQSLFNTWLLVINWPVNNPLRHLRLGCSSNYTSLMFRSWIRCFYCFVWNFLGLWAAGVCLVFCILDCSCFHSKIMTPINSLIHSMWFWLVTAWTFLVSKLILSFKMDIFHSSCGFVAIFLLVKYYFTHPYLENFSNSYWVKN